MKSITASRYLFVKHKTVYESQNSRPEVFCKKRCYESFIKIHKKAHVLESLFNKVAGLKATNFIKKWLQHRYFNYNFCKTLQNSNEPIRLRVIFWVGNYMFKVNNRNTRTRCEICSELKIKTPEQQHLASFWCLDC